MIKNFRLCLVLCWLVSDIMSLSITPELSGPTLNTWPKSMAQKLDEMIQANAHTGAYACFDADQTTYQWDLEEATFAYLEEKQVLTRKNLDSALKIIPFLDTEQHDETLVSYYNRICTEVAENICYNWLAQAFSGLTLRTVKTHVDDMLQSNTGNTTIKTILTTRSGSEIVQTEYLAPIPNSYRAQQELYNRLTANGIKVYVISASHEELVRMVLSDPKYGYNVKPENVFGITTLLKNGTQRTTSRQQILDKTYDQNQNMKLTFTSTLWSPQTIAAGKQATILTYIDQWKMPILVAGDSPTNDAYMLFHGYNKQQGTIRLWVNRKDAYEADIKQMRRQYVDDQQAAHVTVTANKNWIYIKSNDLGPRKGFRG